jgi:putative transposase
MPTRLRRLPNFSYTGPHRYLLTICANDKKPLFRNADLVDVVRSQILIAAETCGFEIVAYCFMPDHVHLVIEGLTASASLSAFVQRAKQLSGFHGKRMVGGPVWQTGYHERVLRADQGTPGVVAYVLANPVRAGLVDNAADHPFSGSGVWTLAELLDYIQDEVRPS